MAEPYIEEFLFRGRDPDNEPDKEAAWHVSVAQFVETVGGVQQVSTGPLSAAKALAAGYDLTDVITGINAEIMLQAEALREMVAVLETERDTLRERASALEVERSALRAEVASAKAALATLVEIA